VLESPPHPNPADEALAEAILGPPCRAQRRALAKAITLLESSREEHQARGDALLARLLPRAGASFRLGISGIPGAGKSTFIEALGLFLLERGHRVAVLAVDPSSVRSGGSILGDKTRMERLSSAPGAFIRPSASAGVLGGVAERTREALLACEAAGYDVVLVETVGVGQSETAVAGMTDMFVLLHLPNSGDDLQAIKRGAVELADLVVVSKADLDPAGADRARLQIASAQRLLGSQATTDAAPSDAPVWRPHVVLTSALRGTGIETFWSAVEEFRTFQVASGRVEARRRAQAESWMWDRIQAELSAEFEHNPTVAAALPGLLVQVRAGHLPPSTAARQLLGLRASQR
jgi:LAO/AO transport system kinase